MQRRARQTCSLVRSILHTKSRKSTGIPVPERTMADEVEDTNQGGGLLPRRIVIYCGACGMPPEYCEYGPDFETHCDPWLKKHQPELRQTLAKLRGQDASSKKEKRPKPDKPWTTEERLTAFYKKYVPEKIDGIPALLEKYVGKEEKLFEALAKKYGPEPLDPYFSDSDGSDDEDDEDAAKRPNTSKRRGVGANKNTSEAGFTGKVLVQKEAKKKKRVLTVVSGLEPALAVNQHKLKDATKAFAKQFAGSSSVKDKDIIVQGDHVLELAELLVDKFQVPEECIYVDMGDGNVMNLRG